MRINFNLIKFHTIKPIQKRPFVQNNCAQDVFVKSNNAINFQGMHCSTSNFEIRNILNLTCPYCDKIMLNDEQRNQFVSDIAPKRGEALAKALEKYEDDRIFTNKPDDGTPKKSVYRAVQQEVVNIIKQDAIKYPDKDLAQLVRYRAKLYIGPLIAQQLAIVKELETYIENNIQDENQRKKLNCIIEEQKEKILDTSNSKEFKRKGFIHEIANLNYPADIQQELDRIVEKLPRSTNNIESFFVKYGKQGYSSFKIAMALIYETQPTTEHLIPRNRRTKNVSKGSNNISNYVVACSGCNGDKGNTPFNEWQINHPHLQEYFQKHLQTVQETIETQNGFVGYDSYVEEIIETIRRVSDGQINLIMPESTNDITIQNMLLKRKARIEELEAKLSVQEKKYRQIKSQIALIEAQPFFEIIQQIKALEAKIVTLDKKIKQKNENGCQDEEYSQAINRKKEYEEQLSKLRKELDKYNVSEEIDKKGTIISSALAIQNQIINLEQQLALKDSNKEKIAEIDKQIAQLQSINEKYANAGINTENDADYKAYCHYGELNEQIEDTIQKTTCKKANKTQKNYLEILQIAKESIQARLLSYMLSDEVDYFVNLETIKEYEIEKQELVASIQDYDEVKEKIRELSEEILQITSGKTISQVQAELEELKEQDELMRLANNYEFLKNTLESMEDLIEYNSEKMFYIKSYYKTMTNEAFAKAIGKLYLE